MKGIAERENFNWDGVEPERQEAIKKCMKTLEHACDCPGFPCEEDHCEKMKRVVGHMKKCEKKTDLRCPVCTQVLAICVIHAKICNKKSCEMMFCTDIRESHAQRSRSSDWRDPSKSG